MENNTTNQKLEELINKVKDSSHDLDIVEYRKIMDVINEGNGKSVTLNIVGAYVTDSKFGGRQAVLVDDKGIGYNVNQLKTVEFFDSLQSDIELYNTYFQTFQKWTARKYNNKTYNRECVAWVMAEQ